MKDVRVYIDGSNLKFGIEQSGWKLNYKTFRSWLRDKYKANKVILFLGLVPEKYELYNKLQSYGYEIKFRPTLINKEGKVKGNVDGELILEVAENYFDGKISNVILVSGDGDYHCIVEFLKRKNIPTTIVAPNKSFLSLLLKRTGVPIVILDNLRHKLS